MSAFLAPAQPVLVVSRHASARALLRLLLREQGYACSAVADGDEAFAAIAQNRPLVAILDMREPEDDELLFLGLLRKRQPQLGAIVLLPGKSLVVHGRTEHVVEHDGGQLEGPSFPSLEQLRGAIEWIATQTHLTTWKTRPGAA
jgi:CheY-like chemotaxis protein